MATRQTTTTRKTTTARKAAPAAKKAAAAKATSATAAAKAEERYIYTATGRGGIVNTRTFSADAIEWAVDVADPKATRPAAKAGLIFRFYESREAADEFAAKKNAEGYDAVVVPAKAVK